MIAMTAHARAGDRDKCLAAGMNDYLTKLIEPKQLRGLLEALVGRAVGAAGPAAQQPTSDASPIDVAALREVTGNHEGLLLDLLTTFIESANVIIRQLDVATMQHDDHALQRAANQLKGRAANIRANRLAKVAEALSDCAARY